MATIPLHQKIKSAVAAWRARGYDGASPVTKGLLEFWFVEDHFLRDGSKFRFWRAQREAIGALIYLYEVCRYHDLYSLSKCFSVRVIFDPTTITGPNTPSRWRRGWARTLSWPWRPPATLPAGPSPDASDACRTLAGAQGY